MTWLNWVFWGLVLVALIVLAWCRRTEERALALGRETYKEMGR
jgi:hypothetical protein